MRAVCICLMRSPEGRCKSEQNVCQRDRQPLTLASYLLPPQSAVHILPQQKCADLIVEGPMPGHGNFDANRHRHMTASRQSLEQRGSKIIAITRLPFDLGVRLEFQPWYPSAFEWGEGELQRCMVEQPPRRAPHIYR